MLNWWVLQTSGLDGKSRSSPAVSHRLLPAGWPLWPCKDDATFLPISSSKGWNSVRLSFGASPKTFPCLKVRGQSARAVCSRSDYETLCGPVCWAAIMRVRCYFSTTQVKQSALWEKNASFPIAFCSLLLDLLHFLSLRFCWDPWNTWGKCYILLLINWPVFDLSFPVLDLILQPALGDYVVLCWTYQEL